MIPSSSSHPPGSSGGEAPATRRQGSSSNPPEDLRRRIVELERQVAENALANTILQNFPIPVLLTDQHWRIQYTSPAFCSRFGYLRRELLGSAPPLFFQHTAGSKDEPPADDLPRIRQALETNTGSTLVKRTLLRLPNREFVAVTVILETAFEGLEKKGIVIVFQEEEDLERTASTDFGQGR